MKPVISLAFVHDSNAKEIAALVNQIYAKEEGPVWIEGHQRITEQKIISAIEKQEIITAHINGELVAAVQVKEIEARMGWFGMLVVSEDHRNKGLATLLYEHCEGRMRKAGCSTMRCEVLVPAQPILPLKAVLKKWYAKLGYQFIHSTELAEMYPGASESLRMDCDLEVYTKSLH